jgi:hypothetical protein
MGQYDRRVVPVIHELDDERSLVENVDPFDETAHVSPELAIDAVAGPALPYVGCCNRHAIRETGALAQDDDPLLAPLVEPPGRSQAGTDAPHAVHTKESLVELTEEQALARVRWVERVG